MPLYVLCFSVGPQMWHRIGEASGMFHAGRHPGIGSARQFRLDPYITSDFPKEFHREDDAHNDVLKWVRQTSQPMLFLSDVWEFERVLC